MHIIYVINLKTYYSYLHLTVYYTYTLYYSIIPYLTLNTTYIIHIDAHLPRAAGVLFLEAHKILYTYIGQEYTHTIIG